MPVKVVFKNPFAQPFRITSVVRSNEALALAWESVPGQSYAVEVSTNLGAPWTLIAEGVLATNYTLALATNLTMPAVFVRGTHP